MKQDIPDQITITCENNGRTLPAYVISMNEKTLVVAVQTVRVTLVNRTGNGTYQGRMGGLDLVYHS
jgi:hypothetical protein